MRAFVRQYLLDSIAVSRSMWIARNLRFELRSVVQVLSLKQRLVGDALVIAQNAIALDLPPLRFRDVRITQAFFFALEILIHWRRRCRTGAAPSIDQPSAPFDFRFKRSDAIPIRSCLSTGRRRLDEIDVEFIVILSTTAGPRRVAARVRARISTASRIASRIIESSFGIVDTGKKKGKQTLEQLVHIAS
ncbi:hypothetical protein Q8F57_027150 [Paraburkholderia terrae]